MRAAKVHPQFRPGAQWAVSLHLVANLPPNPARLKMLYKLPDRTYRLYRPGDYVELGRTGRSHPGSDDLPKQYHEWLDWYLAEYISDAQKASKDLDATDPLLMMRGVGKEIWQGIDVDEFIRQLRYDPDDALARPAEPAASNPPKRRRRVG